MIFPLAAARAWTLALLSTMALAAVLPACAPRADLADDGRRDMVLVILTSGPNTGAGTQDARQAMFASHMANMRRLAAEDQLIIAGPFASPRDRTWRGLFIFDVPTIDRARELTQTDPGVIAGEFTPVFRPLRASPALHESLALGNAVEAQRAAHPEDQSKRVRPYVLVHADDVDRLLAALPTTPLAGRVVFLARFADQPGAALLALDAEQPAELARILEPANTGRLGLDGWYSAKELVQLPEAARR